MKFKLLTSNKVAKDINELVKDALRYRFLRDYASFSERHPYVAKDVKRPYDEMWMAEQVEGEQLDELIDGYILDSNE